jgi:hypothetical protein
MSDKVSHYTADFETTTDKNDCRVWGWGLYNIEKDLVYYGTTINSFFNKVFELKAKRLYFHNLKFDGEFIEYWLFRNKFKHTRSRKLYEKDFSSLITNTNVFYQLKFKYKDVTYTINDSNKIIPLPVAKIPKAFNLSELKGDIDYTKYRSLHHKLTDEEIEYIKHDVIIVGKALKFFFDQSLKKMTQASNALFDYKGTIDKKRFRNIFPILSKLQDEQIRLSYRGGYVYVNPLYQNKIVNGGIVFDVNSLYPSVMYNEMLPFGDPVYFDGKYKKDKFYPLYISMIKCQFELKKDHLPTIQLKHTFGFGQTEYVSSSNGEDVDITLTNVDLELFLEHYNVYNIQYIGGYKFRGTNKLFKSYIDKWIKVKNESTLNGNDGMRFIAKIMLNALYGRFALNPKCQNKIPIYDEENDLIKYVDDLEEEREPLYLPVSCFITAYARKKEITSSQINYDRFLYGDTDSIHLLGTKIPNNIEVDKVKLGAWKLEYKFNKGKFVRAKSYIEEIQVKPKLKKIIKYKFKLKSIKLKNTKLTKIKVCCAGLPHKCHSQVNFDNFKSGTVINGKLRHTRVRGGVVLEETTFTLKL